tara:strand:- start:3183 stop:3785 length:603 start_codon:yes stop_codon:yes gene_type:complete
MKNNTYAQIFVIYLLYLLGFAFIFASIVKIQGQPFTSMDGVNSPISSAWHYFETMYQSGIYWRFIGITQFIAGSLLITQRFSKLGTIVYLPIIANIFLVTISYEFSGTPIISGLMLLSTLFLMYWDWNVFKIFVNKKPEIETKKRLENNKLWQITGLIFLIFTPIPKFFTTQKVAIIIFSTLFSIGIITLIIGLRKRKLY